MKPLNQLRVLNTRPLNQANKLNKDIENMGGQVISLPMLDIIPASSEWMLNIQFLLSEATIAIFSSTNAVNHCFQALHDHHIGWPPSVQVIAIGNTTADTLLAYGINVDFQPPIADSEHLIQLPILDNIKHQRIILFKGNHGRELITTFLKSKKAFVSEICVYHTQKPNYATDTISKLWIHDGFDVILFTSSQAMHHLFDIFPKESHSWLFGKPCITISERLTKEAYSLGVKTVITSEYNRLLNSLEHYNKGRFNEQ